MIDRRSQGKKQLQAWKFGIKLVQELRFARFFWNITLPQRIGATPTRPHRLKAQSQVIAESSRRHLSGTLKYRKYVFCPTSRRLALSCVTRLLKLTVDKRDKPFGGVAPFLIP